MSNWVVCRMYQSENFYDVFEESREYFWKMKPSGKVFEKTYDGDGFVILKYGGKTFKCKNKCFKAVSEPLYKIGDHAVTYSGETGIIREIYWHGSMNKPFYLITADNRKKSRRYFESELLPCCFADE